MREQACPVFIENVPRLIDMRRYKVQVEADFPPELQRVFEGMERQGNPWGIGQDKRDEWEGDVPLPKWGDGGTYEYLFYVGCAGRAEQVRPRVLRPPGGEDQDVGSERAGFENHRLSSARSRHGALDAADATLATRRSERMLPSNTSLVLAAARGPMKWKRLVITLFAVGAPFTLAGASWVKHRWVVAAQSECGHNYLRGIVQLEAESLSDFRELDPGDGFNPDQNGSLDHRPAHRYLYAFAADPTGLVTHDDGGVNWPGSTGTHGVTGHGPDAIYGHSSVELWALWPAPVLAELGRRGTCPDCSITVGCIANLDRDSTPDVWTVSTADRRRGETVIAAGTPWHEVDDDDWPWSLPPGEPSPWAGWSPGFPRANWP